MINELIDELTQIRDRWGNTTVTYDIQWGSKALWVEDDQRKEIRRLRDVLTEIRRILAETSPMDLGPRLQCVVLIDEVLRDGDEL